MWLFDPFHCSQVPEGLTSQWHLLSQTLHLCCTWKTKQQQPRFWLVALRKESCLPLTFGQISQNSMEESFEERLTLFMEDSHASISHWPANVPGSPTEKRVDSGESTPRSFAKCGPRGSLLKTFQGCYQPQMEEWYWDNLPKWGSMRSGELYRQKEWEPVISGREFSCWPTGETAVWATPQSRDEKNPDQPSSGNYQRKVEKGYTIDLNSQSAAWATPSARDWKSGDASEETMGRNARPLNEQADHWTTPQSHDSTPGNPNRVGRYGTRHGGKNLTDDVTIWQSSPPAPTPPTGMICWCGRHGCALPSHKRKLNPLFVEWLMGVPINFTSTIGQIGSERWGIWFAQCRGRLRLLSCGRGR